MAVVNPRAPSPPPLAGGAVMSPSPISCAALSSHQKGNETLARLAGGHPDGCQHGAERRDVAP